MLVVLSRGWSVCRDGVAATPSTSNPVAFELTHHLGRIGILLELNMPIPPMTCLQYHCRRSTCMMRCDRLTLEWSRSTTAQARRHYRATRNLSTTSKGRVVTLVRQFKVTAWLRCDAALKKGRKVETKKMRPGMCRRAAAPQLVSCQ